ncbi:MAG: hypothetical protein WC710_13505 [Gallionella sp.]|jgi:hypothetical protein
MKKFEVYGKADIFGDLPYFDTLWLDSDGAKEWRNAGYSLVDVTP